MGALFPDGQAPAPEELRRPVEAPGAAGPSRAGRGGAACYPTRRWGVECGMLLALRLDGARVGTEDYGKLLLALSPPASPTGAAITR